MDDLLRIENLSKHYDGFDLEDVTFTVPAGSVVGFIGSNGAGKTTTIKALLGLIIPDAGHIELFGTRIDAHTPTKQTDALKQRIGVVFDACAFPEELKVEAVGRLMSYVYTAWDPSAFEEYLLRLELEKSKTVKELSRGMGMKLALACALAHKPELLILDEATAGLDPMAREDVLDILRTYQEDEHHGILLSSHITSDLDKIADYIVCIDAGHVVFTSEKDAITDMAGVAHCRTAEFEELAASGFFAAGTMRYQRHEYGIDVLVSNRFAFLENFSDIAVDKADIESYMSFMLKGGLR